MKRILTIFAALLVISAAFTSCSTSHQASSHISKDKGGMTFKIFQTLGNGEALANPTSRTDDIVKIVSPEEIYYDGKVVGGYFVLIDTYRYRTRNGAIKTVPVFIKQKEYKKWKQKHPAPNSITL